MGVSKVEIVARARETQVKKPLPVVDTELSRSERHHEVRQLLVVLLPL